MRFDIISDIERELLHAHGFDRVALQQKIIPRSAFKCSRQKERARLPDISGSCESEIKIRL
jgi:hypothetical protein